MTLVVAIRCTDGIVIVADSAASDAEVGTKQTVIKIRRVGFGTIYYGGSGDGGLLQKVDEDLQDLTCEGNFKRIRKDIRKTVLPHLNEAISSHIRYPQQPFNQPPAAVLLFAGVIDGKPWILEIERDGRDTLYNQDMGNFAAVGSGKPWAQAVMRPHLNREKDLRAAKIFAYRIVDDAIELASGGLAKPIVMHSIDLAGVLSQVPEEELTALATTCEGWRDLEREAVGEILGGDVGIMSETTVPTPQIEQP